MRHLYKVEGWIISFPIALVVFVLGQIVYVLSKLFRVYHMAAWEHGLIGRYAGNIGMATSGFLILWMAAGFGKIIVKQVQEFHEFHADHPFVRVMSWPSRIRLPLLGTSLFYIAYESIPLFGHFVDVTYSRFQGGVWEGTPDLCDIPAAVVTALTLDLMFYGRPADFQIRKRRVLSAAWFVCLVLAVYLASVYYGLAAKLRQTGVRTNGINLNSSDGLIYAFFWITVILVKLRKVRW